MKIFSLNKGGGAKRLGVVFRLWNRRVGASEDVTQSENPVRSGRESAGNATSPLLNLPPRFVGIVLGDLAGNLGGFLS